jgi:thioredoxin reductase/NAD-dependent dihydropyrimidine dehydrogenase PreA subunit
MTDISIYIYGVPMLLIWSIYLGLRNHRHRNARSRRDRVIAAGLTQPASLHPVIDAHSCIGCRSCVSACPENSILGIIEGKAELINPANCIGHGACKTACPMNAISLVFGTAERGIDIPPLSPRFESNVPGIFIAGELGGMGLIRNAIEQGRQAMESVAQNCSGHQGSPLDVVIVGAGPAGIAATLEAQKNKLRFVTLEQDSLGGTVANFPRGKLVMTAPVKLPLVGTVKFREISKEKLLEFWNDVIRKTGININFRERVEDITHTDSGFIVKTTRDNYQTSCILLALGRRGTPRKLGVPGEQHPRVVYTLTDPDEYRNRKVLVVGGGDSALEAAASIAEIPGTDVCLSYRKDAFVQVQGKNRQRLAALQQSGRLDVLMNSNVRDIQDDYVVIDQLGSRIELRNDAVIICAGGILPTPFLQQIGIQVETKYGTT